MFVKRVEPDPQSPRPAKTRFRKAVAAVEFAVFLPVLFLVLYGLWEYGRAVEVQNVMVSCAREGARDASLGQSNLSAVAANILTYLQAAEPTAFGSGHTVKQQSAVITLPSNTYGYTYWDSTENRELFTVTFTDVTSTSVSDPTGMSQLDHYQIAISVPYTSVGWLPVSYFTGLSRIGAQVDWAAMVDSPFTITPSLSAQ